MAIYRNSSLVKISYTQLAIKFIYVRFGDLFNWKLDTANVISTVCIPSEQFIDSL